ncbi:MAG: hypothetical protein N3G80_04505 [Candidatus Micrarchaeota archaeon]|nr:hypothetical protein [Candidatus Micrarchaeota archaeon]
MRQIVCFLLLAGILHSIDLQPYLYPHENSGMLNFTAFEVQNGTAKIVKISGQEAFLLLNDNIIYEKDQIKAILSEYYYKAFYPSKSDFEKLQSYFLSFNASRNSKTKFGPAEQTCLQYTFLLSHPCDSMPSCLKTASLLCALSGAQGCEADMLAVHILAYSKSLEKIRSGEKNFISAFNSVTPQTLSSYVPLMQDALASMKSGADEILKNKLRFPESSSCADCFGLCPEPKFDFSSLSSAQSMLSQMKEKAAMLATLDAVAEKIALSTKERQEFKKGEELAKIYAPKIEAAQASFGGLAASAIEAKKLVADSDFVSAANAFLEAEEALSKKLATRNFSDFDSALSSYYSSAKKLSSMINNSTLPYFEALAAQDEAGDLVIKAQWRVNKLSKSSVDAYNALAKKKNQLDASFSPPLSSSQYFSLASSYKNLSAEAKRYIEASKSFQDSIFGSGSKIGQAMVDGTLKTISGSIPISFKTRQSMARYVPMVIIAAIDLAILLLGIAFFVYVFYHFHKFFTSKLAISGWVVAFIGFIAVLVAGSVGIYSIIVNSDRAISFDNFEKALLSSDKAAILVDEATAPSGAIDAMRGCASQIRMQLEKMNKTAVSYFAGKSSCTIQEGNKSSTVSSCIESIPDLPVIELQYSPQVETPTFTTIVAKSAIFKGNQEYYSKKPLCDPANVLG